MSGNSENKSPEIITQLEYFINKLEKLKNSDKNGHYSSELLVDINEFLHTIVLSDATKLKLQMNEDNFRRSVLFRIEHHKYMKDKNFENTKEAYDHTANTLRDLIISPTTKLQKKRFIQKQKRSIWQKLFATKSSNLQQLSNKSESDEEPLEIDVDRNEFQGIMHVFVSHKFVTEDQELALSLKRQLRKNNIEGYLAEQKREFDIPINQKIRDKIDESDYLIAIITKFSLRSPSVHQEIGYALGSGCPVRIMVETEEVPGVLVKDREIEEFTRINFKKKLDIIINNIIDKGPRKKIKSKDPQLIQNVYEPCYNQMMNVYGDEFITSIPPNPWDKISHSWRLKTEPEIKNLFKNYSKELTKWRKMSIDFGNQFQSNNKNIAKFLEPIFEKFDLIKEGGRFDFGGSNHDAESWLFNCQDVIFNENISNGDELYQILKRNSIKRWGDRYAITYDVWKKDVPEIYNEISKMIPKLIEVLGARYSYKEIDEQRNILKKCIEKLTLALEEKLK